VRAGRFETERTYIMIKCVTWRRVVLDGDGDGDGEANAARVGVMVWCGVVWCGVVSCRVCCVRTDAMRRGGRRGVVGAAAVEG
jgi:hypothetical protein